MPQIIKISSNAVFESFDDEVIVINMVSGSYFALNAVALRVWEILQQSQTLESVVHSMQSCYQGDIAEIETAVRELIGELESEGLLMQIESDAPDAVAALDENSSHAAELPVFRKPEINKFTDMEELLLLDPIHEVDEAGWPHAKNANEKDGA